MTVPDPQAAAIAENAGWCDRVGRAVGVPTAADGRRWWSRARMPPLHPDAIGLVPGLTAELLLAGVAVGPGCAVKDGHADVDLAGEGFAVVVTGRWWHRPPATAPAPPGASSLRSILVPGAGGLAGGALAGDPEVRLVEATDADGRVRARAVLHEAGDVVGVSNLRAEPGREADAWHAVVVAAAGRHLVGWEPDDELGPLVEVGAELLGPLRVWLVPAAPEVAPRPKVAEGLRTGGYPRPTARSWPGVRPARRSSPVAVASSAGR